jgi:uncharacterized protein (TIGR03435 family)
MKSISLTILIAIPLALPGQTANVNPSFDVAVIKPSVPGRRESMSPQTPGRFAANNLTLRQLIGFAYDIRNAQGLQLGSGLNWIAEDQWDIEATTSEVNAAGGTNAEATVRRLRSLLEDRFHLKVHSETKSQDVFALVVDKRGVKMTSSAPPPPPVLGQTGAPAPPPPGPGGALPANFAPQPGRIMAGPGIILASAVTMPQIVNALNRAVNRPIVDRTDLKGYFNLRVQYVPDLPAPAPNGANAPAATSIESSGPSIFTAVQEQLGLKLEATKVPMEVVVVDQAERPTPN